MKTKTRSRISPSVFPKFFAMMRRAASYQGFDTKDAQDAYYKRVVSECANVSSVREIRSYEAFDACLTRFAADAGDYRSALDLEVENLKRKAYVVKVMAIQIMQLKGLDSDGARNYLEGIIDQSRVFCGVRSANGSFFLDMSEQSLQLVLQMLDTHLRRLKSTHFPTFPKSFDDRIRFAYEDGVLMRLPCDKFYYANQPFNVKFST